MVPNLGRKTLRGQGSAGVTVGRVSEGDRGPGLRPDLAPLRSPGGFRLVFASRTVTALGTQASEVALLVQAKQLTGSPLAVGLLGVVELVPLVVFGLYGGVLADRFDRRALMRWGEVSAVMMAAASLQRPSFDASLPRPRPRSEEHT